VDCTRPAALVGRAATDLDLAGLGRLRQQYFDNADTPTADATTHATGLVNPWAAGDAAALRDLAQIGRAHLNGCP
jgi:hypothetical protein